MNWTVGEFKTWRIFHRSLYNAKRSGKSKDVYRIIIEVEMVQSSLLCRQNSIAQCGIQ